MKKQLLRPASLCAVTLLSGALLLTGCTQAAIPDTMKVQNVDDNVIKVASKEQVKVEPDVAEVIYSVYSQASDAQTCQTQNNTDLQKVLEMLKAQNVADEAIQTSNFGLSPIYDWESGKSITGYEMTTEITVSDIPIEQVGNLLTESVNAGVNSISSVTYKSSKYDESYQQALTKAIEAAKVKAQVMAEAGGCKLGKIVNIEEYGNNQAERASFAGAGKMMNEAAADMSVMPGEIEIEASINVEFIIE